MSTETSPSTQEVDGDGTTVPPDFASPGVPESIDGETAGSPQLPHPNSSLHSFLQNAIEATNPPLRHLASHSTLGSLHSRGSSDVRSFRTRRSHFAHSLATNFEEQRANKPGLAITRNTREYDPSSPAPPRPVSFAGPYSSMTSSRHFKRLSDARSNASTQVFSEAPLVKDHEREAEFEKMEELSLGADGDGVEEEEIEYPGPLALSFLIIGLCLSVFLISLDRTIITTVSRLSHVLLGIFGR
jgi:hypothetical protein